MSLMSLMSLMSRIVRFRTCNVYNALDDRAVQTFARARCSAREFDSGARKATAERLRPLQFRKGAHQLKGIRTMSVFGKILEKLGLRKNAPESMGTKVQQQTPSREASPQATQSQATPQQRGAPPAGSQAPPAQMPMSEVDVEAKLEQLAAANPQKLNWRTSIVDLMKLLGMESSLAERKELAAELGYPPEGMNDSAKMNIWLHKAVLWEIAKNGGNVPKELLDR
jgi:hypothetical protein